MVREFGCEILGRGLGDDHHGVTIDRWLAIEETAEMLDIAHANRSAFELDLLDDTGLYQAARE